jgi:CDP-6-deoxy-D-xylo-4-hexulose-3-dehydrase
MYNWPLNINNFTFLDRIKIASRILNPSVRWTQDQQVLEFEKRFADFVGCSHSIFVSSGSTANTLLAMRLKDTTTKKTILFPSTTWITSVSPFIREGFIPKFIDISLDDLSIDLNKVIKYLENNGTNDIACIFITSLLGFTPDIIKLQEIEKKYNVKIMLDNCENTFGLFENKNISSFFTSTTSTYFGHQIQSVEGGFIFTNSDEERDYFRMARNHGMTRSLNNNEHLVNPMVDSRFDFNILGNNFRNTDINAYIGLLDLNRVNFYKKQRIKLYNIYKENLDSTQFILPQQFNNRTHVPFSLPIICNDINKKINILKYCENKQIETRPIISGNLLRQTCLQKFGNYKIYKNSELLNNNGLYVGLYSKLKSQTIINFVKDINNL